MLVPKSGSAGLTPSIGLIGILEDYSESSKGIWVWWILGLLSLEGVGSCRSGGGELLIGAKMQAHARPRMSEPWRSSEIVANDWRSRQRTDDNL